MKAVAIDGATRESWREVLSALNAAGLRVSTLREALPGFDPDTPGKDSWRHREAGADEVMLSSVHLLSLVHAGGAAFPDLLARLEPVDLVLVEGFRNEPGLARLDASALGAPGILERLT